MFRDTDSSDTLTLTHGLKLKNALTVVSPSTDTFQSVRKCQGSVKNTVSEVSVCSLKLGEREVSVKRRKILFLVLKGGNG